MKPVALISLPGARLDELALAAAETLGLDVVLPHDQVRDGGFEPVDNSLIVLPSDFLENGGETALAPFQDAGGMLIFVEISWEDSWKAVANDGAPNAEGLPWRTVYRVLARKRAETFRKEADLVLSGTGSFPEVAERLLQVLSNFKRA